MKERERVETLIRAIAEAKFHEYYFSDKSHLTIMDELIKEVLAIEGLCILSDNKELPICLLGEVPYRERMREDNFKRVIKGEK